MLLKFPAKCHNILLFAFKMLSLSLSFSLVLLHIYYESLYVYSIWSSLYSLNACFLINLESFKAFYFSIWYSYDAYVATLFFVSCFSEAVYFSSLFLSLCSSDCIVYQSVFQFFSFFFSASSNLLLSPSGEYFFYFSFTFQL